MTRPSASLSWWETPKALALIVGATAAVFGTAAGLTGYQLGIRPPAPALTIVFQPGAIRVELPGAAPASRP